MDPRYKEFGEIEFSTLYPTMQLNYEMSVELNLFRLVNSLRPWR